MNDLEKYDTYMFQDGRLYKISLWEVEGLPFDGIWDWHHFLRKTVRKCSPKDYKRWETYQRMIAMPHEMNLDIESMGEKAFEVKWKIPKFVVVFNRDRWRVGFYDSKVFESYYIGG